MKKIIYFILMLSFLIMFAACNPPYNPEPTTQPTTAPTPPPVIPAEKPIKFALYDGTNLKYFDGENLTTAYTGNIREANKRVFSIENTLNYFDNKGKITNSYWLSMVPDEIITVPKGNTQYSAPKSLSINRSEVAYQDDVWMVEHITPEEAYYNYGGLYRDYVIIYKNGVAQNEWWEQQWNPKGIFVTECGLIVCLDPSNGWHNVNGNQVIWKAYKNGICFYDMQVTNHNGYIADNEGEKHEQWSDNYFNGCRWQEAGGMWYATHGYTWSYTAGLTEYANVMKCFIDQTKYPVWIQLPWANAASLVPAGALFENNEWVLYWIECNRGTLFKFIPSIDQLQFVSRIYLGDGSRAYGANQVNIIKPVWCDGYLYFHNDGSIKRYDPATGLTSVFCPDQELYPWE